MSTAGVDFSSISVRFRWKGLAALVGGVIGIAYAPLYALAYFATEDGASSLDAPFVAAWADALRPVVSPLVVFASPEVVYLTYGKLFTLVALGWLIGLTALHSRQAPQAGMLERWGFHVTRLGLVLALAGSIVVYWMGSVWPASVDIGFFALMVPSLLLFGIGFPIFGVGTLRADVTQRLGAWLLIVGGLPGMVILTVVLGQLTLGLLLLNLAWVVLGYDLYKSPGGAGVVPSAQSARG